ncbi:MAG: alpha/beta hydrolase [Candidatus Thorarchaeota archaeon]
MTLQVSAKFRPDIKKVMERRSFEVETATKEFIKRKQSEGIDINEEMLISNANIVLEFQRYTNAYSSLKMNDYIPMSVKFERVNANGVPAEWITPPNTETKKVLFYLFGGAFVAGMIETRRWMPYLISQSSHIRALLIGYRLAPEHPFPAALEDSIKAYQWLLSVGIKAENIIIAGSSSGGGLAISTLLKLKELSLPLPAGSVVLSPWTDLMCSGESMKINAEYEPDLSKPLLRMAAIAYSGGTRRKDPLASPLYANLKDLPPILIHVGSIETLRDDSLRLADRAKAAGVAVTLEVWKDMPHVFHNYYNEIPESKDAIQKIGKFIQTILI